MCEITHTTSAYEARKRVLPLVVGAWSRLPPLCLLPGATPAQEAEMFGGGKATHIIADFGQDGTGALPLDARNLHEPRNGLLIEAETLLNRRSKVSRLVSKNSRCAEHLAQQDAVMGVDASFQSFPQLRQLAALGAACQVRQPLRHRCDGQ